MALCLIFYGCAEEENTAYLGKPPPGTTPELFVADTLNTTGITLNGVFAPNMEEFFFTSIVRGSFMIHHTELVDGKWSAPAPLPLYPYMQNKTTAFHMTLAPDGQTMYFAGRYSPGFSSTSSLDLWKAEKKEGKWQKATALPAPVSTPDADELYPILVGDGSLYFISDRLEGDSTRHLFRAQALDDGSFDTPQLIDPGFYDPATLIDAYLPPDESYVILSETQGKDGSRLVVAHTSGDTWSAPEAIPGLAYDDATIFCSYVTPDGQYLFFSKRTSQPPGSGWMGVAGCEMYWVDMSLVPLVREGN